MARRLSAFSLVSNSAHILSFLLALKISANFFGAISAGLSLYFIGRRWTAILVCAMFILPLVAIAIDYGPRTELAGVVALNVARTQLYATFSVYAAEVTAPNLRASVISVYFVSYNMGEFVGTLFPRGSRTLTMVSLLVTLGSTALAFKATNTPHWLSLKGRRPEAAQLFKWLRGDADVEELEAMQNKLKAPAVGGRAAFVFKFYTPLALFVGLRLAYADSCELVRPTFDDAVRLYEFTLHDSLSDPVFMGLTTVSLFHYGGALLGSVIAVGLCLVAGRRLLFLASSLLGISIFYVHLFAFVSVKTAFYATLFCDFFNFLGAEQIIIIMPTEVRTISVKFSKGAPNKTGLHVCKPVITRRNQSIFAKCKRKEHGSNILMTPPANFS